MAFLMVTGTGGDFAIANGGCGGGGGGHGGLADTHVASAHFEGGQGFGHHDFSHRGFGRRDHRFHRHHWFQIFFGGYYYPYDYATSDNNGYYSAAPSGSWRRPDPTQKSTLRIATQQVPREREASGTTRVSYKRRFPPQNRSDPPQPMRVADPVATQPPLIVSNEAPEALP
jgi:hypothetical protein